MNFLKEVILYKQKIFYDLLCIIFINLLFFTFFLNLNDFIFSILIDLLFVISYFSLNFYKNSLNIKSKFFYIFVYFLFSLVLKNFFINNIFIEGLYLINIITFLLIILPRYFLNLELINNSFSNDYLSSKKNILVIGGLGYIGSHLVDDLLEENKSVTVLDCQMYGDEVLNKFSKNLNFKFIKAYASDVIALSKAIKDSEIVVHLAGLVGDPACALDENETKYLNIKTTSIIQNLCSEYGIKKLIFASSCSVYGKSEDKISNENSKLNPVSLYAQTKRDSEEELLNGKFTNVSIVRFATVFGHSFRERYDLVCNLFCAQAYYNKEITVEGGTQRRPFIHVKDAARSLKILINTSKDIRKSIFNIGFDDQNYSIADIASQIKENIKDTNIKYLKSLSDQRDYFVNFNKFNKTFNFSKTLDLKSGIHEIINNFELKDKYWSYLNKKYSNKNTTEAFLSNFKGDKSEINNFN